MQYFQLLLRALISGGGDGDDGGGGRSVWSRRCIDWTVVSRSESS